MDIGALHKNISRELWVWKPGGNVFKYESGPSSTRLLSVELKSLKNGGFITTGK